MIATVIRNGQHSGGDHFVEVQETPSAPYYAVPVSGELPPGTQVEITVKVIKDTPAEKSLVGSDVSTTSAPVAAVEESPLAVESKKAADVKVKEKK